MGVSAAALLGHAHEAGAVLPVEGGSANFVQVSGPQGRSQTFNAGASVNTFIWNPTGLKGQLAGGDFLYARRIKIRSVLTLNNASGSSQFAPNWEVIAQAFGNVRVFSPFLGELLPKSLNSVPLLSNHDQYYVNGFRPITRKRQLPTAATPNTNSIQCEFVFEIPFERDYLDRSIDSCPWMPFLEGGTIEVDLAPSTSLGNWGWTVTSCTQTCTIDYYVDKQAQIHSPVQSRLYKVTTTGPEFVLKSVGSPNGLEGVTSGSRLAIMSWLSKGDQVNGGGGNVGDNGFYAAFGGSGGPLFGTNGLSRLDIPFRDQVSIDDVSAWLEAMLSDCNPVRMFENLNVGSLNALATDICQWPFMMAPKLNIGTTTIVNDQLDFFPLIWVSPFDKISDMQKVNGDLTFTATQPSPPGSAILNLFRTDEVCGFTPDKVMDLMERMGLPHRDRGGNYLYVPKYSGAKKADPTTIWGFPLKIITA